ncbi:MAG: hypothetical protein IJS95_08975 [Prevotella sp.]|nr:hypothetical protein [Prevotella sp.]
MMNKEELDKRIAKEEKALSLMLKFRGLSGESNEEFEKKVDYYLDCLIPLYKERKKLEQE